MNASAATRPCANRWLSVADVVRRLTWTRRSRAERASSSGPSRSQPRANDTCVGLPRQPLRAAGRQVEHATAGRDPAAVAPPLAGARMDPDHPARPRRRHALGDQSPGPAWRRFRCTRRGERRGSVVRDGEGQGPLTTTILDDAHDIGGAARLRDPDHERVPQSWSCLVDRLRTRDRWSLSAHELYRLQGTEAA
jgi:hypothetical protein